MPLPILPLVAGGALLALLGAGKAEQASDGNSANTPGNVAPTQQSTGGTNGGAQAPSHSDNGNSAGTPGTSGSAATAANLESMFGAGSADASNLAAGDLTGGTGPGYAVAEKPSDPWAPSSGSSLTPAPVSATKLITGTGAVTARAAGDAFVTLGHTFGAIW